jgi:uncharacterized protein
MTNPGVPIEEGNGAGRSIELTPSSITAFMGLARQGPVHKPFQVSSHAEFEANFGGLAEEGELAYAVGDFFLNGGTRAIIVRLRDKGAGKEGLAALEKADLFNLLCIPPFGENAAVDPALIVAAASLCEKRRAMLLVDPPATWKDLAAALANLDSLPTRSRNAALYFPRLQKPDPLSGNRMRDFAPCGAVAGIYARTDSDRGFWKAPAGLDAAIRGAQPSFLINDQENGVLNPRGINCLRVMRSVGLVVWGSRTLQGDDQFASDWKYVPVRRTALVIEESLVRGLQWAVFEPNGEPLWAQIRLAIGAFMQLLFRQGAFQGATPAQAYFVKCDATTTTQTDINLGFVNIVVGFAPLKPAEFVIIQIQQIAGQARS